MKAIKINSNCFEAFNNLGSLYQENDMNKLAEKFFKKQLSLITIMLMLIIIFHCYTCTLVDLKMLGQIFIGDGNRTSFIRRLQNKQAQI